MPTLKNKSRIVTVLVAILFCLNTWAASGSYSGRKTDQLASGDKPAQFYCDQAKRNETPEREANLLLCANALLKNHKTAEAKDILTSIKNFPFQGNLLAFKSLVDARLALMQGNSSQSITLLKQISPTSLSLPVAIEYRDLLARAYEANGQFINSVTERVTLDSILSDRDMAEINNELIWSTLQQINPQTLKSSAIAAQNHTLKGWLELATIERNMNSNDPNYTNTLASWESNYRGHPGKALLPSNLSQNKLSNLEPKHIALLLPLSGKLSSSAEAVRDGFLAASALHGHLEGDAPRITVLDTQDDQNVAWAYQNAINQGADIIVGPLTKNGVESLISAANHNVPVLALNYVDENTPRNFVEFGLAPEDEARQAADRAWQDGHVNALIIAQNGDWGQRLTSAFRERWDSLGGQVIDTTFYSTSQPLSNPIKAVLHIDASENRARRLRDEINMPLEYDVRRRQDIDMVFMAAQPQEARQIPPLLAFYFANDLPIYATSSVYTGYPNPAADKDLNEVTFCDIPWNIDSRPAEIQSRNPVARLWPATTQAHPRLYALGVDAYQAIALLPKLEALPNFSMNGATGKLSLNNDRRITRGLRCTKFVDGEPKRLDSNV